MATTESLAIRRSEANDRLAKAIRRLANRLDIEVADWPEQGRDAALLAVRQTEALADQIAAADTAVKALIDQLAVTTDAATDDLTTDKPKATRKGKTAMDKNEAPKPEPTEDTGSPADRGESPERDASTIDGEPRDDQDNG